MSLNVNEIMLCIIFLFIAFYIILAILWAIFDIYYPNRDDVKITFDQFKTLQSMSPDKWRFADTYDNVVFYNDDWIVMKHFIDVIRLKIYRHKKIKNKKIINRNKVMVKLINEWQKDIDKYNKENINWVEHKIDQLHLD